MTRKGDVNEVRFAHEDNDGGAVGWIVCPARTTDDEVRWVFDEPDGYRPSAPGRAFCDPVHIRRTRTRVLATQRCGYDV